MSQRESNRRRSAIWAFVLAALSVLGRNDASADPPQPAAGGGAAAITPAPAEQDNILPPAQARKVDRAVDRALAFIATKQAADGSYSTHPLGQPGVTAICVMAYLSRGHLPGKGPYGKQLDQAIKYVLESQNSEGYIVRARPFPPDDVVQSQVVYYNTAISGLMLSELYGQVDPGRTEQIRPAIEKAMKLILERPPRPKRYRADEGGWRYYYPHQSSDSDLSATSWNLMFLRSCKNAGFEVRSEVIDEALGFVRRCYDDNNHIFWYALRGGEHVTTRAMTGAGILALSLGGRHQTQEARQAAEWLLQHPFREYRGKVGHMDRFFYGAFYCSQAMFQMGGRYWREFYPVLCDTLIANQRPDGSWEREPGSDQEFGFTYTTALGVLALSPPYQLLPIFQR